VTTDEVVTEVYNQWGEDPTNAIVTIPQVVSFANRGQRQLCRAGNVLLTCAFIDTKAGQEEYNVPIDYIKTECAFLGVTLRRLFPMNVGDRDPNKSQGIPAYYFIWGGTQNGVHVYTIGLNPIPRVDVTGDLVLRYRKSPLKMVHSDQGTMVNPEVIESWQDAIIDYALMMIYRRLGKDFADLFKDQREAWKGWITEANNFINPLQNDYPMQRRDTGMYDQPSYGE
jgi:hypothetical protein